MLGEAALTAPDAERYLEAYRAAIAAVGARDQPGTPIEAAASISVKLSALHPRYESRSASACCASWRRGCIELARRGARRAASALTVDAEEAERLELSLELLERVCARARARRLARASASPCRRTRSARRP